MEQPTISWSNASLDQHSQLFPTSVFSSEALDNLDMVPTSASLTYATLESVKTSSSESNSPPRTTITVSKSATNTKKELIEQPIDLTLSRPLHVAEFTNFNKPPALKKNIPAPRAQRRSSPLVIQPQSSRLPIAAPAFPYDVTATTHLAAYNNADSYHVSQPTHLGPLPTHKSSVPVIRPHPRQPQRCQATQSDSRRTKLKALVCEYINYLIEENEQLTQISRAYTVPTPLDFENEHYFEEVRNTDHHFPSEKFTQWLEMKHYQSIQQQHTADYFYRQENSALKRKAPPPTSVKAEKSSKNTV